jgi:hypothetical protein
MGSRNPDRVPLAYRRRKCETVQQMIEQGWEVLAKCGKCELLTRMDLRVVAKVKGPSFSLWNQRSRCRGAAAQVSWPFKPTSTTAPSTVAAVTVGLPVKDKNGMTIGSVADVKTETSGEQVATIRIGADSFAVDTSALAVDNGAAVINATEAQIKAMLPKGK